MIFFFAGHVGWEEAHRQWERTERIIFEDAEITNRLISFFDLYNIKGYVAFRGNHGKTDKRVLDKKDPVRLKKRIKTKRPMRSLRAS
jgi:hypothetical protein